MSLQLLDVELVARKRRGALLGDGWQDGELSVALFFTLGALSAARRANGLVANARVHGLLDNGASSGIVISRRASTTLTRN